LKALKLTIRNAPLEQPPVAGKTCLFTGEPAKEYVLIGRSYSRGCRIRARWRVVSMRCGPRVM
jgi:hypothetical protein